jgi:hypothetical protein
VTISKYQIIFALTPLCSTLLGYHLVKKRGTGFPVPALTVLGVVPNGNRFSFGFQVHQRDLARDQVGVEGTDITIRVVGGGKGVLDTSIN